MHRIVVTYPKPYNQETMELGGSYLGSLAPKSMLIIPTLFTVCLGVAMETGALHGKGWGNVML